MIDVEKIRSDFPILKRKVNGHPLLYLDNAATSQKPKQVINAISSYYENNNANVHRGIHALSEEATEMVEGARKKIGQFIGANNEREIIFVRNASEAINLVMYSWGEANIKKDDEVVISLMEHHSNLVTWQMLCRKKKATLKIIDVDGEGVMFLRGSKKRKFQGVELVSLEAALGSKTKLVSLTHVSNVLGTVNPMEEIVKMVKKKSKAKILVDGSQSVPYMPVDVKKLGADWVVFSGHKMLGPTGIGVLWGKEEILNEMPPFLYGGDMISEVMLYDSKWNQLPWKFEAGTPNMAGMVGLGAAVDYLEKIGMENVWGHEQELADYAMKKLGKLEKEGLIEIYGPRGTDRATPKTSYYGGRAGLVSFNVKGVHAHDTAEVLNNYGIAVRSGQHCGAPVVERFGVSAMVRASFYIYNTKEEIDYLVEKIGEVKKVFKLV